MGSRVIARRWVSAPTRSGSTGVVPGEANFVGALRRATSRDLEFGGGHHFRHLRLQTLVSALAQTNPAALAQGNVRGLDASGTGAQNRTRRGILRH